jgi:2-amino-4-hydroxy-6-hydroxymethyldihydropteridine diphosphokinase
MEARALLSELQRIEFEQGRRRGPRRWGPRSLDLDLLVFGDQTLDTPDLTVPHPRMAERAFVLRPMADIDPAFAVPGLGTVSELLAGVSLEGVRRAETRS